MAGYLPGILMGLAVMIAAALLLNAVATRFQKEQPLLSM